METKLRTLRPKFINQRDLYHPAEMITLLLGFMMIIMALVGVMDTTFLGLSLSPMHAFVLGCGGLLATWSGLSRYEYRYRTLNINITLGVFFIAHVLTSLLLNGAVLERTMINESLVRKIAPGFLELTPVDNTLHLIIGFWFLLDAYFWKKYIKRPGSIY